MVMKENCLFDCLYKLSITSPRCQGGNRRGNRGHAPLRVILYIHEGRLCIESGVLRITARCCMYLLRSGVNYTNSESLESKGVKGSRVRLCNRSRE